MYDRIGLKGMVFYAHHGVFPAENEFGQPFSVDLDLYLDLKPAGRSDNLAEGVDYSQVYEVVRKLVTQRTFSLIEALAEAIAASILQGFPRVMEVAVRVRKPQVPLPGLLDYAEVEIRRVRG